MVTQRLLPQHDPSSRPLRQALVTQTSHLRRNYHFLLHKSTFPHHSNKLILPLPVPLNNRPLKFVMRPPQATFFALKSPATILSSRLLNTLPRSSIISSYSSVLQFREQYMLNTHIVRSSIQTKSLPAPVCNTTISLFSLFSLIPPSLALA